MHLPLELIRMRIRLRAVVRSRYRRGIAGAAFCMCAGAVNFLAAGAADDSGSHPKDTQPQS